MSEVTPEAPTRPSSGGKKENVFTHKFGPLPMWAWVAIISAVLIGYYYWKNKKAASQTPTVPDASQVPQFVNQVYTNVTPPTAPATPATPEDVDLAPWHDERGKSPKIRNWEHKHPGQEYPFNSNPEFQPSMTQAATVPGQTTGPLVMPPAKEGGGGTGPPRRGKHKGLRDR